MTNNLETVIRAAEKRNAETAAARQAAAADMAAKIAEARAERDRLAAVPADLLAAVEAGEDVPAAVLIEARTAAEIAEKKVSGLEKRAPRNVGQVVTNLAGVRAVAPLFEGLVNDVPVIVTSAPSSAWLSDVTDADAPAIVLAQVSDTLNAPDGLLTAREIEATFIAPAWASGIPFLSVAEIEKRARAAGIGLDVMGYGDYHHDRIGMELTHAFEALPVISRVSDMTVTHDFAARVLTACRIEGAAPMNSDGGILYRGTGKSQNLINGSYVPNTDGVVGNVSLRVERGETVESVSNGERTIKAGVTFVMGFGGTASQAAENKHLAHNAIKDAVNGMVGQAMQGMGRIMDATYEPDTMTDDLSGSVVIEYVSRVGH